MCTAGALGQFAMAAVANVFDLLEKEDGGLPSPAPSSKKKDKSKRKKQKQATAAGLTQPALSSTQIAYGCASASLRHCSPTIIGELDLPSAFC